MAVSVQALPPVRHSVLIRAGSGKIWSALTTKAGLEAWFSHRVEIRLRKGGAMRLAWKDWGPDHYSGEADGRILAVDNRKRFAFVWQSHPTHPKTEVDIRLEAAGPITVVRLVESKFDENAVAALPNAAGWGEAVTPLKFYVEPGVRY